MANRQDKDNDSDSEIDFNNDDFLFCAYCGDIHDKYISEGNEDEDVEENLDYTVLCEVCNNEFKEGCNKETHEKLISMLIALLS